MVILLLVFWIILNGRISVELTVVGVVCTLILFRWANRRLHYTWEKDLRILKKLPLAVFYVVQLLKDMLHSTLGVMHYVYTSKYEPEPQVIEFDVPFATSLGMTLMANYITLTPGTITVDAYRNHFTVHCLDPEFAPDPEGAMVQIIRRMEET